MGKSKLKNLNVIKILKNEKKQNLHRKKTYINFSKRIEQSKENLRKFIGLSYNKHLGCPDD